jgi:hypothetical protein
MASFKPLLALVFWALSPSVSLLLFLFWCFGFQLSLFSVISSEEALPSRPNPSLPISAQGQNRQ